jgi:hypothetical protein
MAFGVSYPARLTPYNLMLQGNFSLGDIMPVTPLKLILFKDIFIHPF